MGAERRRRRMRRSSPAAEESPHSPTPTDIAEMGGTFAMTAGVQDPGVQDLEEPATGEAATGKAVDTGTREAEYERPAIDDSATEQQTERGLRGLVGGGSSQVSVAAALRARDAARPTEADLAAAERDLVIVRRGWVPREELPPRGPRH
jgi:hypothetical protein